MDNRDFKGVWIPKEIWLNTDLSAIDKCLLTEISSLDNESHCWASNKYFAEFLGVSESTVTRSIKKLEELGLISVEMQTTEHGSIRVIQIAVGCSQNDERGVVKMTRGVSSFCLSNNIVSNNIENSISKDILTEESEYESHMYSLEELSGKQKKKSKGKNLYEKCVDEITEFTDIPELKDKLIEYLKFRMSIKDKPLYGVAQWKSMLNKLDICKEECKKSYIEVIQQSLDKAWLSFYPVPDYKPVSGKRDVFAEGEGLSCEQSTDTAEERAEILANSGRRSEF